MKLVMTYDVTDGYTYNSEIVQPFEYESLEKAYCDFIVIFEDALCNLRSLKKQCVAGCKIEQID